LLRVWRYKVVKDFGVNRDRVYSGENLHMILCRKPRPDDFQVYKRSKRMYDYTDYTNHEFSISEITMYLEFLGYIKFILEERLNEG